MNTMTMANALKAVFGAQTLTTASYFPACAQDGTPSGVISAANLASVLGVGDIKNKGEFGNGDLDTISNKSFYGVALGGVTHRPVANRCYVVQLGDALQFAYDFYRDSNSKGLYMRIKKSDGSWFDWALFGYQ